MVPEEIHHGLKGEHHGEEGKVGESEGIDEDIEVEEGVEKQKESGKELGSNNRPCAT